MVEIQSFPAKSGSWVLVSLLTFIKCPITANNQLLLKPQHLSPKLAPEFWIGLQTPVQTQLSKLALLKLLWATPCGWESHFIQQNRFLGSVWLSIIVSDPPCVSDLSSTINHNSCGLWFNLYQPKLFLVWLVLTPHLGWDSWHLCLSFIPNALFQLATPYGWKTTP